MDSQNMPRLSNGTEDFSPRYLDMVIAAREVQSHRLKTRVFATGDHVLFDSPAIGHRSICLIDELSGGMEQPHARAWLPQLHQLFSLLGADFGSSFRLLREALSDARGMGYLEGFSDWNELVLALLMWRKFDRRWDGKEWVGAANFP